MNELKALLKHFSKWNNVLNDEKKIFLNLFSIKHVKQAKCLQMLSFIITYILDLL